MRRDRSKIFTVKPSDQANTLLYRVLLVSEMVGAAGQTTLSLAEIVGISERNNRRD